MDLPSEFRIYYGFTIRPLGLTIISSPHLTSIVNTMRSSQCVICVVILCSPLFGFRCPGFFMLFFKILRILYGFTIDFQDSLWIYHRFSGFFIDLPSILRILYGFAIMCQDSLWIYHRFPRFFIDLPSILRILHGFFMDLLSIFMILHGFTMDSQDSSWICH